MIHIVAVSYFGSVDLPVYVSSLLSQTYTDWRLTIVDNADDPDEASALDAVARADERITVVAADGNAGYLGGARHALSRSSLHPADWTVVSNTDVSMADSSTLQRLAEHREPGVGQLAPSIISARSGQDQNPHLVRPLSVAEARRRWIAMRTPVGAQLSIAVSDLKRRVRRRPRDTVADGSRIYAGHGSFVALSRAYFDAGGHLEHPLFLFGEEIFLAEQLRTLGLSAVYAPDVRVRHREHAQTKVLRSRRTLRYGAEAARYSYQVATQRAADDPRGS